MLSIDELGSGIKKLDIVAVTNTVRTAGAMQVRASEARRNVTPPVAASDGHWMAL